MKVLDSIFSTTKTKQNKTSNILHLFSQISRYLKLVELDYVFIFVKSVMCDELLNKSFYGYVLTLSKWGIVFRNILHRVAVHMLYLDNFLGL